MLERALALGFDAVATGHYARLETGADGLIEMHRAEDAAKDQSYVLGVLTQDQLAHALFPLGDSRKEAVRVEAERRGLAVAHKPDSHDICFIPDGDTRGWLSRRVPQQAGQVVDTAGRVVGEHAGAAARDGFALEHRDVVAPADEVGGGRQAAQPGADDDDSHVRPRVG